MPRYEVALRRCAVVEALIVVEAEDEDGAGKLALAEKDPSYEIVDYDDAPEVWTVDLKPKRVR